MLKRGGAAGRIGMRVGWRLPPVTSLIAGALATLAFVLPGAVSAQSYAQGQRVTCGGQPGTVIASRPGEMYNGHAANTGYFYRVRVDIDGPDADGRLCRADETQAAGPARPAAPASAWARASAPARATQPVARTAVRAGGGSLGFGARDPRVCPHVRSLPTNPQIVLLVQCQLESKTGSLLILAERVSVQAGRTRPYNYYSDHGAMNIDPAAPVLPIRGAFVIYRCGKASAGGGGPYDPDTRGRNCAVSPQTGAQGICWRTTFGDWSCSMLGASDVTTDRYNQPPPGN